MKAKAKKTTAGTKKTKLVKKTVRKRAPRKAPAPSTPPSPSPEEVLARLAEQENLAKRRIAVFMERTLGTPWLLARYGSFEMALLGGLRNLLAETAKDLVSGRYIESREATCFFLFGVLSSLRTVFYREAMHARVAALSAERGRLTPTDEDTSDAVFEARVYNNAAQREDVLERFRALLALAPVADPSGLDRLMEQARVYDTLNTSKGVPKA